MNRPNSIGKYTILLIVFFLTSQTSFGEGTRELRPAAGDAGYFQLDQSWGKFAQTTASPEERLHIRICNVGEKIYYGFGQTTTNSSNVNDVSYQIKDPSGNIVVPATPLPSVGAGRINTYNEAVTGPVECGGAGGYTSLSYTPTTTGDYYIEFLGFTGRRDFEYFDITVADASDNAINGRLWSQAWQVVTRSYGAVTYAKMYVLTDDGIVYSVDFNGMDPYTFVINANPYGTQNTGVPADDRKSRISKLSFPQYKIFLNDPDNDCFPTGEFAEITAPTLIDGCSTDSVCVNVNLDQASPVALLINLNGVPGYQEQTRDRIINADLVTGSNCIWWDRLDGFGNPVPTGQSVELEIDFITGITHMPLWDVEEHDNGFIIDVVRPAGKIPWVFWDDTEIPNGTSQITNGCVGSTGCHNFPNPGSQFGNNKTINTWWYTHINIETTAVIIEGDLDVNLPLDTTIECLDSFTLDAETSDYDILWSTGETTQTISVSESGQYWVQLTDGTCEDSDTMSILFEGSIDVDLGPDMSFCDRIDTTLEANIVDVDYLWSTNETTQSIQPSLPGEYIITVTQGACEDKDTLVIFYKTSQQFESEFNACDGDTILLKASTFGDSYTWHTNNSETPGASPDEILVTQPGIYAVHIFDGTCTHKDTQIVSFTELPEPVQLPNDTQHCSGSLVLSSGSQPGMERLWSTGEVSESIVVEELGEYWVTVSNSCGITGDTVKLSCPSSLYVPNVFSPNSDGLNDVFYTPGVNVLKFNIWIYDRWGTEVYASDDIEKGWDGRYKDLSPAVEDVYVYKVKMTYKNEEKNEYVGHVSLVR